MKYVIEERDECDILIIKWWYRDVEQASNAPNGNIHRKPPRWHNIQYFKA